MAIAHATQRRGVDRASVTSPFQEKAPATAGRSSGRGRIREDRYGGKYNRDCPVEKQRLSARGGLASEVVSPTVQRATLVCPPLFDDVRAVIHTAPCGHLLRIKTAHSVPQVSGIRFLPIVFLLSLERVIRCFAFRAATERGPPHGSSARPRLRPISRISLWTRSIPTRTFSRKRSICCSAPGGGTLHSASTSASSSTNSASQSSS
jgi:hypothetical protein